MREWKEEDGGGGEREREREWKERWKMKVEHEGGRYKGKGCGVKWMEQMSNVEEQQCMKAKVEVRIVYVTEGEGR